MIQVMKTLWRCVWPLCRHIQIQRGRGGWKILLQHRGCNSVRAIAVLNQCILEPISIPISVQHMNFSLVRKTGIKLSPPPLPFIPKLHSHRLISRMFIQEIRRGWCSLWPLSKSKLSCFVFRCPNMNSQLTNAWTTKCTICTCNYTTDRL